MALHEQWVSQKKWNVIQGKTRQNKARTWKSHHHWELEALHGMLLGGLSLKPLWTNGLYDTIMIQFYNASSCIILYHRVSISSLDRFALRKWQLVSQVHTLRSRALWPRHSCQFQGQVARLPSHLTPWIQIDPMNLTSSMTCFSLTPPEQSTSVLAPSPAVPAVEESSLVHLRLMKLQRLPKVPCKVLWSSCSTWFDTLMKSQ